MPKRPPQHPGWEFASYYESAQEVGGDYYDFIPMPNSRMGIMLGDVAGKGVPAALLMAKVSSDARFCTLTEKTLGDAVSKLNVQMQEAGLLDRFVTLEDTTEHKPHPEPLLRGLELLGSIPKRRAAYVGDSPFDVEAAKAAGLTSVAVSWGAFSEGALRAAEPDHLVPDIQSAVDVLLTL